MCEGGQGAANPTLRTFGDALAENTIYLWVARVSQWLSSANALTDNSVCYSLWYLDPRRISDALYICSASSALAHKWVNVMLDRESFAPP